MYIHKILRSALSADKLSFSVYTQPHRTYEFTSITVLESQLNNLSYIRPLWQGPTLQLHSLLSFHIP
jgi:hypothetical protein